MKNIKTILALFIFAFCILSCSKDEETADKVSPVLEVFRIKEQALSSGELITYEYNSDNKLIKRGFSNGVFTKYTYNDKGQIMTQEIGGIPNIIFNTRTNFEYDQSGAMTTAVSIDGANAKDKKVYTNNSAGFPLTSTYYSWNNTNNTWVENTANNNQFYYNATNQMLRFTSNTGYVLYTYDDRGNQNERKNYLKKADGSFYLKSQINTLFDNNIAIQTVPILKEKNNALEIIEKNYAENGVIVNQFSYIYLYQYNAAGYPEKKYSNGILKESNTFEKVN